MAAGLLFVAVTVMTVIQNTTWAVFQGSINIYAFLDLSEILAFILLAVSAFTAVHVIAAVGGAMLGLVYLFNFADMLRVGILRKDLEVEYLLYSGLLTAACVFIILFAVVKQSRVIGFIMTALWFLGNLIHMVFGFAGMFFVVRLNTGNYLPLIIPLMTVLALLMYALSARKE